MSPFQNHSQSSEYLKTSRNGPVYYVFFISQQSNTSGLLHKRDGRPDGQSVFCFLILGLFHVSMCYLFIYLFICPFRRSEDEIICCIWISVKYFWLSPPWWFTQVCSGVAFVTGKPEDIFVECDSKTIFTKMHKTSLLQTLMVLASASTGKHFSCIFISLSHL